MAAENNIVGEVGLRVTPVDNNFEAGVQKIISRLENAASQKISVGADTSEAEQAVDQLVNKSNQLAGSWIEAAVQVGAFTAAVYGVRAAVDSVINKFSQLFDQLIQAQAGFTSILGGAAAGGRLLADVQEFARVSPFVTQELVNYSQQLLGVGVAANKIVPILESTGDIISSVGGDTQNIGRVLFTLTQIQSIGRLTGQDAIQLQSALIPITKYLADYLGKTTAQVKKMQEAGSISAETVFSAIQAQGEKVEGAMALATRTIGGAKSVLTDSIEIFLQNQPVLQAVNEDIIQGIKAIAAAFESTEVQNALTDFFDAIGSIYEDLKPLIASLTSFGSESGFTGLTVVTTILENLAVVLDSIPVGVLQAIGIAIAALLTVRTPLLLAQYVTKLQEATTGLLGMGRAAAGATPQVDKLTAALSRQGKVGQTLAANMNKVALGFSAAAVAAGTVISDGEGGGRDTIGGILTGAGTGAGLGFAVGGAPGAAVGAVIGGGISAVSAINEGKKRAANEAAEAARAAGEKYAEEFVKVLKSTSDEVDINVLSGFFEEISGVTARIDELQAGLDAANVLGQSEDWQVREEAAESWKALNLQMEETVAIRDALLADEDLGKYFQNIADNLALIEKNNPGLLSDRFSATTATEVLKGLDGDFGQIGETVAGAGDRVAEFLQGNFGIGGGSVSAIRDVLGGVGDISELSAENVQLLDSTLQGMGITLEQLATQDAAVSQAQIERFTALPNAWKDAVLAANDYQVALEKIKKASAEIFGPFKKEITETGAALKEVEETRNAFTKLFTEDDFSGQSVLRTDIKDYEINAVGQQLVNSAAQEYENTLVALEGTVDKATAEQIAQANSARVLYGEFQILQETLGLTDSQFRELLESTGLWTAYSASLDVAASTNVETLDELAARLGIAKDVLADYLSLSSTADGNSIIISSDETDAIIADLESINNQIANYQGAAEGLIPLSEERIRLENELELATREVTLALEEQKSKQEELLATFTGQANEYLAAAGAAREFSGTLGSLFEIDDNNVVVVTDDLNKLGSAAESILTNATAITNEVLNATGNVAEANAAGATRAVQEFEAFRIALGLSQEEFEKVLADLRLLDEYQLAVAESNGVVAGTVADIATQTGVSVEQLYEFAGIYGAIDPNKNIVITVETAEALERIAEVNLALADENLDSEDRRRLNAEKNRLESSVSKTILTADPKLEEINKQAEDQQRREREAAAKEAERVAAQAQRDLEAWNRTVTSATDALTSSLEQAAENIASAADRWVGSIKERTQYEQSVSAQRLIGNAERQSRDLTELQSGIQNLRSRGVSDEVLEALGIDNVADLRQVRKLVNSDTADLQQLTASVSNRDKLALQLATSEEDRRTRTNITAAILDAAKTLNIDITKERAGAISNQFNITPGLNAEEIAFQILGVLSGGKIGR